MIPYVHFEPPTPDGDRLTLADFLARHDVGRVAAGVVAGGCYLLGFGTISTFASLEAGPQHSRLLLFAVVVSALMFLSVALIAVSVGLLRQSRWAGMAHVLWLWLLVSALPIALIVAVEMTVGSRSMSSMDSPDVARLLGAVYAAQDIAVAVICLVILVRGDEQQSRTMHPALFGFAGILLFAGWTALTGTTPWHAWARPLQPGLLLAGITIGILTCVMAYGHARSILTQRERDRLARMRERYRSGQLVP